jgi:hypothetical protein
MKVTSKTRSKHVDVYPGDIEREEKLVSSVMEILTGFGINDAEVYVSSVEKVEGYDAVFLMLNIEVPQFTETMLEEIKNIIHKYGFVERSGFKVIASGDKVHVMFDLIR